MNLNLHGIINQHQVKKEVRLSQFLFSWQINGMSVIPVGIRDTGGGAGTGIGGKIEQKKNRTKGNR